MNWCQLDHPDSLRPLVYCNSEEQPPLFRARKEFLLPALLLFPSPRLLVLWIIIIDFNLQRHTLVTLNGFPHLLERLLILSEQRPLLPFGNHRWFDVEITRVLVLGKVVGTIKHLGGDAVHHQFS